MRILLQSNYCRAVPSLLSIGWILLLTIGVVSIIHCGKRGPSLPPPSEPPPPVASKPAETSTDQGLILKPHLELRIEPLKIAPGESALLTWETRNADEVRIDPNIGAVDLSGRIKFFPDETTTYQVTAHGPGGETIKSVTVEVNLDRNSDISVEDLTGLTFAEQFAEFVRPVFFAFDSAELSQEAKSILDGNIQWLSRSENNRLAFLLEGHADERGSDEYNLALGMRRANAAKNYLVSRGIAADRIEVASFGEERPLVAQSNEDAWAQNRRDEFIITGGGDRLVAPSGS